MASACKKSPRAHVSMPAAKSAHERRSVGAFGARARACSSQAVPSRRWPRRNQNTKRSPASRSAGSASPRSVSQPNAARKLACSASSRTTCRRCSEPSNLGAARSAIAKHHAACRSRVIPSSSLLSAKLLQPELANSLQHQVARLATRTVFLPQQALIHERGDALQHGKSDFSLAPSADPRHGLRGL